MKTNLVTISSNATAEEAAALMTEKGIGSLLVTSSPNDEITGIITERDLVVKALAKKNVKTPVIEIATRQLIAIDVSEDLTKAAELMGKKNIKRLIAKTNSKIVGIITQKDLISISPSLYELIAAKQNGFKTY